MLGLSEAYRAARPNSEGGGDRGLEATLAALCARGRAAHPDLEVDDVQFARHLAGCRAPVASGPDAIRADDLLLACAALGGNETAIKQLQRMCRRALARHLGAVKAKVDVEDVEQRTWNILLVDDGGRQPDLATYSGRGAIARFVGITAQRIAFADIRRGAVQERTATAAAEIATSLGDPELLIIKSQYRGEFEQAIREGLQALGDRERMIYRMHIVEGLTVDRIAKAFRVSQSTVSRWLAAARERTLSEARRLLRERLLLPEGEFESVVRLMISQLDLSVSSLLIGL